MIRLPFIKSPKYIVFSDFDETYFSHTMTSQHLAELRALEDFLQNNCEKHKILFGFISGSTKKQISDKFRKFKLKVLPHFIASSLGTQISYECQLRKGEIDRDWDKQLERSQYSFNKTRQVIQELEPLGIKLLRQKKPAEIYMHSYLCFPQDGQTIYNWKSLIQDAASKENLKVNISQCNPLAGDPFGAYDVDFIAPIGGKGNTVRMLSEKFNVPFSRTLGFGDSENDLEMLKSVGNGFWVANAMDTAKKHPFKITKNEYASGILEIIKNLPQIN